MAHTAMDTPSQNDLAAIEAESRFFMRLLLGAGIVAAALVGCGVVWHEHELAASNEVVGRISEAPGLDPGASASVGAAATTAEGVKP